MEAELDIAVDPSEAFIARRFTHAAGERLLAHVLDSLATLVRCALIVAFEVDPSGAPVPRLSLRGSQAPFGDARALLARLAELEPIDPFSPHRAAALGARVLSAADAGGVERVERSLYGTHLRRHGFGVPAVLYFRREGAIRVGLSLFPAAATSLEAGAVRFLGQLHPLLEQALRLAPDATPSASVGDRLLVQAGLTEREAQVARLAADGAPNAAIARALNISQATVKTHLNRIYGKLAVRSRTQLAVLCGQPPRRP